MKPRLGYYFEKANYINPGLIIGTITGTMRATTKKNYFKNNESESFKAANLELSP